MQKRRALLRDVKRLLQIRHSKAAAVLADFGLVPTRQGKKTPAVLAAAADKAQATRAARHTMGKRQKAKIKGQTKSE
jgi:hypothetical protein